jgi:hypothetical protein
MAHVTMHSDLSPDVERFNHTPPSAAPVYWQEAMYLHFAVPYTDTRSELAGGFVYVNRRPLLDGGRVFRASALCWRHGEVWYHASVVPTVFDDEGVFQVTNPFSEMQIKTTKWPHREAKVCPPYLTNLHWEKEHRVSVNLTFAATREPFLFEGLKKMGFAHYEQLGLVTGSVTADGQEVPISGAHGARDHTRGTRQLTILKDHWLLMADLPGGMIHLLCAKTSQAKLVDGIMRLDRTGVVHRVVDVIAQKENPQHIVTPAQLTVTTDQDETHTLSLQRPVGFVMPVSPKDTLVNADAEMSTEITWRGPREEIQGIGYAEHLQTVAVPPGLSEWPFPIMGDDTLEVKA